MSDYRHEQRVLAHERVAPAPAPEPLAFTAPVGPHEYVRLHQPVLVRQLQQRLAALPPPAHERVKLVPGGLAHLFEGLDRPLGELLSALFHPTDPWTLIDEHRVIIRGAPGGAQGLPMWEPRVGDALWFELAPRIRDSFARMAPRYAARVDVQHPAPVLAGELVTTNALDRLMARLLCDPRAIEPVRVQLFGRTRAQDFRSGLRPVEWTWLGSRDRRLWNWIEVREPRDVTVEELAAAVLPDAAQVDARDITGTAPQFRIPGAWARELPGARQHAPDDARDDALALASSTLAIDVAIAQAPPSKSIDHGRAKAAIERSVRQLERAHALLVPWNLHERILPALELARRHREQLPSLGDERFAVLEGQQELLFEAVGAVQRIAGSTRPVADDPRHPAALTLDAYALAIGQSHLYASARAQLAVAHGQARSLTLDLLDEARRENARSAGALRTLETDGPRADGATRAADVEVLEQRLRELRTRQLAGEAIEDDAAVIAAELRLQSVELRAGAAQIEALNVRDAIRDSRSGVWNALGTAAGWLAAHGAGGPVNAHMAALRPAAAELIERLVAFGTDLREQVQAPVREQRAALAALPAGSRRLAFDDAARRAQASFDELVAKHDLERLIKQALAEVELQHVRTAIVKLAVMIGVSVVGGIAGAMAGSFVRGALVADAAAAVSSTSRIASAAGTIVGLAVDAGVTTAGEMIVEGDSSFANNFLTNAAVVIALKPVQRLAATWGTADEVAANANLWQRSLYGGKVALRKGVVVTAEMVTGAAVSYAMQRIQAGERPDDQTAAQWALTGASMAIGRFVSGQMTGLEQRLGAAAERSGHLLRRAREVRKVADAVAATGDKDGGLELLVDRKQLLDDEQQLIADLERQPDARISPQLLATLKAGNAAELAGIQHAAFAEMPLRLAGLEPDDASGSTWIGATADFAIAIRQAERAGIEVEVLARDARQWKIRYNGQELTIIEAPLHGRPRAAKAELTDADRLHARREAEASRALQAKWEAVIAAKIEASEFVEVDHVQVGHGIAGVMNQSTLPATGDGLGERLVVYEHPGTLSSRGPQHLGQAPGVFDAPGLRGSEQSAAGDEWISSDAHGRALDIGRLETQTPAYRATVIAVEHQGNASADAWQAPARPWRIRLRSPAGKETWCYAHRVDHTGGPGPADTTQVAKVVEPDHLHPMLDMNLLLRGSDPDFMAKLSRGRVLVWGGSPTGAWAGEAAARAGADTTVMGRSGPDMPRVLEEYRAVLGELARDGESPARLARKAELEAELASAHRGIALPRNRKLGAAYAFDAQSPTITFGTPTRITPDPDGGVLVTIGSGLTAKTSRFDQVIFAHGQDPGGAGGPGALLGRGADGERAPVPAGTIKLRPIVDRTTGDILGLESFDPEGLQLKGASYASEKLAPWVDVEYRSTFVEGLARMRRPDARTRDGKPISEHSAGVIDGIEHQRDKLPRANEIIAARSYRLPGADHTLHLSADPAQWDQQVREYLTKELRADQAWLTVTRLGDGRSAALVYDVTLGGHDVGIFKVFDKPGDAHTEVEMLKLLKSKGLKAMTPVAERGEISVDPKSGYHGAVLMEKAKGTSVKQLIKTLSDDPTERIAEMRELERAVVSVANGLAELHAKFEAKGELMPRAAKQSDADYFIDKYFGPRGIAATRARLGDDFEAIQKAVSGDAKNAFLAAEVPATAYHGDANAGNFIRNGDSLSVIDVGNMRWSFDESGKANKTGAADVAKFLGSLETLHPGKLRPDEIGQLRRAFDRAYFPELVKLSGHQLDRGGYRKAELWYRLELEFLVLTTANNEPERLAAKQRIQAALKELAP